MKTGDPESIAADVVRLVAGTEARLTCRQVIGLVSRKTGANAVQVKRAVSSLVAAGTLRYIEDCGFSFLEKNYGGCVSLSPHVSVAPPGCRWPWNLGA